MTTPSVTKSAPSWCRIPRAAGPLTRAGDLFSAPWALLVGRYARPSRIREHSPKSACPRREFAAETIRIARTDAAALQHECACLQQPPSQSHAPNTDDDCPDVRRQQYCNAGNAQPCKAPDPSSGASVDPTTSRSCRDLRSLSARQSIRSTGFTRGPG